MQIKRFSNLKEITKVGESVTYYWPMSRIFGALDAFILDCKNHKCCGLQMTINKEHGIKVAPLIKFLDQLKTIDKDMESYFVSV